MKLNKKRDKDCYIYLEDGVIKEEDKNKDSFKIMDEQEQKLDSKNNTNPNDSDEARPIDFYDNLSKYIPSLPSKKTFNKVLISLITVIAIILTFITVHLFVSVKKDSSNELNFNISNFKNTDRDKEELYFLADVIQNSNKLLKDSYDSIYTLLTTDVDRNAFNNDVLKIKENIQNSIIELNQLNKYITIKNFNVPISILESRFNNISKLCDKLNSNYNSNNINFYNSYAKTETLLQKDLINSISYYFDYLDIEYTITNENTLTYSNL